MLYFIRRSVRARPARRRPARARSPENRASPIVDHWFRPRVISFYELSLCSISLSIKCSCIEFQWITIENYEISCEHIQGNLSIILPSTLQHDKFQCADYRIHRSVSTFRAHIFRAQRFSYQVCKITFLEIFNQLMFEIRYYTIITVYIEYSWIWCRCHLYG